MFVSMTWHTKDFHAATFLEYLLCEKTHQLAVCCHMRLILHYSAQFGASPTLVSFYGWYVAMA